jgi:hypothetical protein
MMNVKRIILAIIIGAVLGIFCILGAGGRVGGWLGNEILLIGLWYNRVIMGAIIGLAGDLQLIKKGRNAKWLNATLRGVILGLLVSLQFYLSTSLLDLLTFIAGIMYGVIIDVLATLLTRNS